MTILPAHREAAFRAWAAALSLSPEQARALLRGLAPLGVALWVPGDEPAQLRWSPRGGDARAALWGWMVLHGGLDV